MLSSHFRITAIIWRTRRAPSLSALDGVGSVPRASQRIVRSNIAPLLQPRPNLPTGRRRHGAARILLGGVAARHDRPSPREGGGGFRSISALPFRDAIELNWVVGHGPSFPPSAVPISRSPA